MAIAKNESEKSIFETDFDTFKNQSSTQGSAYNLEAMMERYSAGEMLTDGMFHIAGEYKGVTIHEFKAGRLRIYCAKAPNGGLIVLSHTEMKKNSKNTKAKFSSSKNCFGYIY
ncbi:hypothetical protein LVJ82_00730 [Vitreoscilla massiliensis]|uniref:Uncharacterized protein n=1 Tax=Vitreoscilla massiliensis TaxID=1689272 RepID=A0ABY4E2D7_9NEIS|nr:hypothetical protein [Vitreoscilla massiliensis]UOO89540.1 hypothetical protein LVJ82_00730 [Vitreoscilla massiliensis]